MAILSIQTAQPTGLASVTPSVVYILTSDTFATVTTTGYLTQQAAQGFTFNNQQMALVYTTDQGPIWLRVVITYSGATVLNTVVSLVDPSNAGDVVLPTVANYLAHFTGTTGTISSAAASVINPGNIQAGLSGTSGYLASFPSAASKGSLRVTAVANTGDTLTTISNAAMGQASVISIPDPGQATSEFIIADSAGTQHITSGSLDIDAGSIISGLAAGGFAGSYIGYSTTAANGSLRLLTVNNAGNFAVTISNASHGQSSVVSIPDGGQATAEFIISDSAGTQHITSGGFQVDAGTISGGLSAGGTAGRVDLYAPTTANGVLSLLAVNAGADFDTTISNAASVGQNQVITIPDVGASTGVFATSPSISAAIAPKTFVRTITAGFAALAAAGTVTVQPSTSGTCQFTVVDIKVMYAAAGLSGGGGDRLLNLTDGTIVFNQSGITAALLGTPVYTTFGGTGNPLPGSVSTISTAGAAIVLQYAGGTTDYTAGDITVQVTLAQVTL